MHAFDPHDPLQAEFIAFGRASFPDQRDDVLDRYVDVLKSEGPQAVASASRVSTDAAREVLQVYAERAAARAVQGALQPLLMSAIVAVVVGGLERSEFGALRSMATIDDACTRIGVLQDQVFAAAVDIVGHPGTIHLAMWLSRQAEDRTLDAMGFTTSGEGLDFRYVSAM